MAPPPPQSNPILDIAADVAGGLVTHDAAFRAVRAGDLRRAARLLNAVCRATRSTRRRIGSVERDRRARSPAPPPALLVTVDEAAALLAISRRAIWSLASSGDLPRVRLGPRSTRFRRSDLLALIERRTERF